MPSRAFPGPGSQRTEPRAACSWCLFALVLASCTAAPAPAPVDGDVHDVEHPSTSSDGGESAVRDGAAPADADAEAGDATTPEPSDAMTPWSDAAIEPVDQPCAAERLDFSSGWSLQTSAALSATGADISRVGFSTTGWHTTRVPATVLSALVADGTYPDPRVMDNHDRIPRAPFQRNWWYRYEFDVPASYAGSALELRLEGVTYKANVWLNGERIADTSQIVGTFVLHRLDVSSRVRPGERNALAIEIFPTDPLNDLSITFHDWSPNPADNNMGLWRGVSLERTDAIALHGAYVVPNLSSDLQTAKLTVVAEVENKSGETVRAPVRVVFEGQTLVRDVELAPHAAQTVRFEPAAYPELNLSQPRVWWPAGMGPQSLYELCVAAGDAAAPSDQEYVRFGLRNATSEIDANGHRLLRMNGKPFFVRGAGWTSDMLLEFKSRERLDDELAYFLDLGFNTLRMEGKFENQAFHDRADELGIVTLPGWMCCDKWEQWVVYEDWQNFTPWGPEVLPIAVKSTESAAEFFRNHPSSVGFYLASDWAAPDPVTDAYTKALRDHGFQGSLFPSATHYESRDLKSGFKMTGPYMWVPPHYWFFPHNGGNFGFITESCPGEAIAELDSLRSMLTPAELDTMWRSPATPQLHAGGRGSDFESMEEFGRALFGRHGTATSLEDFVLKAQLMNYESNRVPFEAYRRNKYARATGFVYWLLNNAWPSLIWHLWDHSLRAAGGYFGVKKACEAVHIQYDAGLESVSVVSDRCEATPELVARVRLMDLDLRERHTFEARLRVPADGVVEVCRLPPRDAFGDTHFLWLELSHPDGARVSRNFYWLSSEPDVIDFEAANWYMAPQKSYASFAALSKLPAASLELCATGPATQTTLGLGLRNAGTTLAFFVRLQLLDRDEAELLPTYLGDNFISLLPGEAVDLALSSPCLSRAAWVVATASGSTPARLRLA